MGCLELCLGMTMRHILEDVEDTWDLIPATAKCSCYSPTRNIGVRYVSVTYLAVEVIVPVAGLAQGAVVALLAQLETRPTERQTAHKLAHAPAIATLAFQACAAYL